MIWSISALFPHPAFGGKMSSSALESLPEIALLNYAYDYPDLSLDIAVDR